ncbi:MAG TPA: GNAT family N-acetyltransferase [Anaeromyxobacter sp.]|nr:GNAT family N-acetyltransferase [Anaeromyxobacter sp.]
MSFQAPGELTVAPPLAGALPRAVPGGRLEVAVVDDGVGFDALEREWNALLERSDASVFQSFEWQRTWWRHFGEGRRDARLHLVTLRGPDGLAAIAPLYVERVLGPLGLRRLLFVGHRDSDYLDVLAARGREADCAEALAAHLSAHPEVFDVAVLEETPDRSRMGHGLCEAFARRGWATSRFVQERCPQTALAKTWDETIARFDIANRREVRRRLRNMQKEHAVELEIVPAGGAVEPSMREFVDMHQERWARDGYWGAFADPAQAEFHCDVAERLSRRGWLLLAFLRVDGRRCAVNYGFSFRSTASVYLTGARAVPPRLARHSPGRSLHALGMQWAIAHGRTLYDFMRGSEPYKYELGAIDVPNWTIVAYPRRPRRTEAKHALHLFLAGVERRTRREAHALRVASRGGGWLSREVMAHAARAARRALADLQRILGRRREVEPVRA